MRFIVFRLKFVFLLLNRRHGRIFTGLSTLQFSVRVDLSLLVGAFVEEPDFFLGRCVCFCMCRKFVFLLLNRRHGRIFTGLGSLQFSIGPVLDEARIFFCR
ncbi:hypothetical protein ACP275_07G118300 [Erythranthe tilingii]